MPILAFVLANHRKPPRGNCKKQSNLAVPTKIFPCMAQLTCSETSALRRSPWDRYLVLLLATQKAPFRLRAQAAAGSNGDLGIVDRITASYISSLQHLKDLTFEAVVPVLAVEGLGKAKKKVVIEISVNILGPESLSNNVGDSLERVSAHLQHPLFLRPGIRYINPHYFYLDREARDLRHLVGPRVGDPEAKRISDTVEDALASLDSPSSFTISARADNLTQLAMPSGCLISPLQSSVFPSRLSLLRPNDHPATKKTV